MITKVKKYSKNYIQKTQAKRNETNKQKKTEREQNLANNYYG